MTAGAAPRRRAASADLSTGVAAAFVALAAALSFGLDPNDTRPAWHLRGTIAPDAALALGPKRLPAAPKRA